ncbi:hypothetical protein B0I72DRAFT_135644 [Yarrowia lipolytica]|uniref:YALI0E11319p n=2 Tax=Yarrowia lipolytica TaxID=4952 RepID=Q6C698_YARLI|nr:YALI0E11319p [Yarrowia lipolytica CLIB122]AOW05269.1 hypothetical protein YALI1_E14068g [Yarrowia lipolytica]KAB8283834.1 hypothetical protein BKA91DRAFT_136215 [Yarrowia lipolytica]KAE8172759.1 hypothetical protein BKA90DRAFT_136853 [Yarrowia lipolytica]KAJ8056792.1 hypothetical protein LXG23DRAFT_33678 [Yarrowia lipolytica]RDW27436.1 hypothetical protein B0I71DRAFT_128999 [Yarrowia lipolytica]|eukprot:XP_503814.1 YALI0E11319p [Yarrowia lipolytica CLIB122]
MTKPTTPLHSVDFYDWNVLTQFKLRGDLFKDPVLNRVASYFNEGVTYLLNGGYVYKARGSGKWMALPKTAATDEASKTASPDANRDYPKELLELIISDADSASSLEECKIVGRDPSSWAPEHRVLLERATESNPDLSIVADFLAIGGTYAKKDNYLFRVDNGVDRMVVPRGDVRDQLIRECLEGISEGEDPVERVQTMVAQYYVIPELETDVVRVMSSEEGEKRLQPTTKEAAIAPKTPVVTAAAATSTPTTPSALSSPASDVSVAPSL